MISISIGFRGTRGKDKSRPGVVYFRLYGPNPDGSRFSTLTNTCITGADESVLTSSRDEILYQIRIIYNLIEAYIQKNKPFTILDVVEEYRSIMRDKNRLQKTLEGIDLNTPIRADIFSVGSGFHKYVKSVYPEPVVSDYDFKDLVTFISYKSQVCKAENKISTSRSYTALNRVLIQFYESDIISWRDVDESFVCNFAEWLIQKEFKISTQGYYMGMLRTLLFQAAKQGLCHAEPSWFKKVTTAAAPKTDEKNSSYIDIDVIKKINSLDLHSNDNLLLVRDMYIFAFYCRGMELFDVAHLTGKNIHGDVLVYNKRLTGKEVRVPLEKEALAILRRYNNGNTYLFPLLENGRTDLFPSKRNWVNTNLKQIGKKVGAERLTFVSNIEVWSSMFSKMRISEKMLAAI